MTQSTHQYNQHSNITNKAIKGSSPGLIPHDYPYPFPFPCPCPDPDQSLSHHLTPHPPAAYMHH